MGIHSGQLLDGPDVKYLDNDEEDRQDIVDKEVL